MSSQSTYDGATTDRNGSRNQLESGNLRQRLLGCSDKDKLSLGSKEGKVTAEWHLGVVGCTNDQIKRSSMRLENVVPSTVSGDKLGSSELGRIVLFALRVGNSSHVGTQSLGEQECKMSEPSDSNHTDFLARASTVGDERVVNRDASAEHGSSERRVDIVRNLDDKTTRRTVVVGVSSKTLLALGLTSLEDTGIGTYHACAVVFLVTLALGALLTTVTLSTNADEVPDFDVGDLGADSNSFADCTTPENIESVPN